MTKQPPDDTGLVHATRNLGIAMDKYRKAAEIARIAMGACEEALAELNSCQIAVDAAIATMKKDAPQGSRWQGTVMTGDLGNPALPR